MSNPLGLKLGPSTTADELRRLVEVLNPTNTPGRLTLISRMGHERVSELLPPLVEALRDEGRTELWTCDPMHGNTFVASGGQKTRRFDDVLSETSQFFLVHQALGHLAGRPAHRADGRRRHRVLGWGLAPQRNGPGDVNYTSICDPRLNATQSLDMAFHVAEYLQRYSTPIGERSL